MVNFRNDNDEQYTNNNKRTKRYFTRNTLINGLLVLSIFVGATSSGMAMGYPAVFLPQLQQNTTEITVDENMGSWIASIINAAMPVGSLICGLVVEIIGRRYTLFLQTFTTILGWIIVAFSPSYAVVLIGRFMCGAASGIGIVVSQVYYSEVSKPNMRGILMASPYISYSIGILFVYALGALLHWRIVAGLSNILTVVAVIIYCFMPESHIWLIKKGRIKEATDALTWFRGNKREEAEQEIEEILHRFQNQTKMEENISCGSFLKPYVLKPLVITSVLNLLQTLSGVYVVVFYVTDIIYNSDIKDLATSGMLLAIITAVVRLVCTTVACFLIVSMSRRSFMLSSGLATSFFALVLGTCLYNGINNYFVPICLFLYVGATVGLLLLPGIMLGELFPARVRGFAGGLSNTIYSLVTFGVAKSYPFLKHSLNIYGLFWLFSFSSFLLSVVVYLMLPETKNSTLLEIEDYFLQSNILWRDRKKIVNVKLNKVDDRNLQSLL